jgi:hypothetical protein
MFVFFSHFFFSNIPLLSRAALVRFPKDNKRTLVRQTGPSSCTCSPRSCALPPSLPPMHSDVNVFKALLGCLLKKTTQGPLTPASSSSSSAAPGRPQPHWDEYVSRVAHASDQLQQLSVILSQLVSHLPMFSSFFLTFFVFEKSVISRHIGVGFPWLCRPVLVMNVSFSSFFVLLPMHSVDKRKSVALEPRPTNKQTPHRLRPGVAATFPPTASPSSVSASLPSGASPHSSPVQVSMPLGNFVKLLGHTGADGASAASAIATVTSADRIAPTARHAAVAAAAVASSGQSSSSSPVCCFVTF